MLASYHRVVKPDIFAAAVAASGPLTYVFGTQMWADTSNKYHEILADSLDVNTGSKVCSGTVRQGLDEVLKMTKHKAGRRQLAALFSLCPGTAAAVEKSQEAGFAFYMVSLQGVLCGVTWQLHAVLLQQPAGSQASHSTWCVCRVVVCGMALLLLIVLLQQPAGSRVCILYDELAGLLRVE